MVNIHVLDGIHDTRKVNVMLGYDLKCEIDRATSEEFQSRFDIAGPELGRIARSSPQTPHLLLMYI